MNTRRILLVTTFTAGLAVPAVAQPLGQAPLGPGPIGLGPLGPPSVLLSATYFIQNLAE